MIPKILNKREPKIPFTKEGFDQILKEREELLAQRPEAIEHLQKARAMGDLKENGYYQASRQKLNFLDGRLRRLERLVKLGVIVESKGNGTVDIGSVVTVQLGDKTHTYTIVGGYESDPTRHTVSQISPLGKALLGKRKTDTAIVQAPAGSITYTIISVE